MDGQRFDDLTRALAGGLSRRTVLKSVAAGLAATVLGASGGSAQGNSDCARFCNAVFGPGRARGRCKSDAAQGQGLCPACGADAGRVCVAPDGAAGCPDRNTDPLNCGACNIVCPSGACAGGACLKANGEACGAGGECLSTFCVDGVCCDGACGGQCEACGSGACLPVAGPPVGGRAACASDGSVCGGSCDGVNGATCTYPAGSVVCADSQCRDGDAVSYACDGAGGCDGTTAECGLFVCRNGACLAICQNNDDCLGAAYCAGGVCAADKAAGQPCGSRDECADGRCTGGVCCASDCLVPANGSATCADGSTCGFACNDGFRACDGACIPINDCCPSEGCCADADCDTCACEGCDPVTNTCVSRCDAAAGEACSDGACITVCPGQVTCRYVSDPCEGTGCKCAAQGDEYECLDCCRDGSNVSCGGTAVCGGQSLRCCCDATTCSCVTPIPACCDAGDICTNDGPSCCTDPQGETTCKQFPIFTVRR